MTNPLLEQYGIHKLTELNHSPYSCLLNSKIEKAPHQIEAFIAALQALKNGGIILADEVGLGKTIEAGLLIRYLMKNGAKRILIAMPPPLRKQWQDELEEKFGIVSMPSPIHNLWEVRNERISSTKSIIPESKYSVQKRDAIGWRSLLNSQEKLVIITSYGFAPWFIKNFSDVKWDCFIFDEAHRLRNFGTSTKMPKAIFDVAKHIPKIMLTATPLQNDLRELYALSQYIDERIFINENVFHEMYVKTEDYNGLRDAISPILHRTLRKDVTDYIKFSKRDCMTMDFQLTPDEAILYTLANDYLQRPKLYAVTVSNNTLVKMVIRKLLASSSYAVAETFVILRERLKILKENTHAEKADVSLKAFFKLIDDDDDNSTGDEIEDKIEKIDRGHYRTQINEELAIIENIIKIASKIKENSKINAVIEALTCAFDIQKQYGYPEKALIFTESKRTQKYLVESLTAKGFDKIILFNGEMNDPSTKKIYNAWKARNPKRITNTPSIDLKQAIVEQFQNEAKILIATDIASEGLNLQFCDTIINYDLPWNPMKIEQRIGRCHRFGQKRDVWVYNLLNTQNAADKRVYEILEKKFNLFKGVFGASDEALGLLESGSNFEKKIMSIYEHCKTANEFKKEFDKLEKDISSKQNRKGNELKHILSMVSSDEKKKHLITITKEIDDYISDIELWTEITKKTEQVSNVYMQIQNCKIAFDNLIDLHGFVFIGKLISKTNKYLPPFIIAFDKNGIILKFDTMKIIEVFKHISETNFVTYLPSEFEKQQIITCYEKIAPFYAIKYLERNKPIIEQHNKLIKNWVENQHWQYKMETNDKRQKICKLNEQENTSKYFQEKMDIQKTIGILEKELKKRDDNFHHYMLGIEKKAEDEKNKFKIQFEIEIDAMINLLVKF